MAIEKTAIVTGAGTGIGKAVATALLQSRVEHRVRRPPQGAARRGGRRLPARPRRGRWRSPATSPGPSEVDELFETAAEAFGRVDLLFNNAGMGFKTSLIDEIPVEVWNDIVAVNLTGSFLCARAAFAAMRRQNPQGGRIINNGSVSAHAPRPGSAPYTATKHAITGLTKTLALDGRPFDIACGQIDIGNALTDMAARDDGRRSAGQRHDRRGADDGCRACRPVGALHGQPAARRQRAVHDGDGDQHAVRRTRVGRVSRLRRRAHIYGVGAPPGMGYARFTVVFRLRFLRARWRGVARKGRGRHRPAGEASSTDPSLHR